MSPLIAIHITFLNNCFCLTYFPSNSGDCAPNGKCANGVKLSRGGMFCDRVYTCFDYSDESNCTGQYGKMLLYNNM